MATFKLKETDVEYVQSEYDCPVCLELIIPPTFQCCNGHLLCGQCIEQISVCPICRDALPEKKIRNLAVEKIVRELKRPCPFRRMGCREELTFNNGYEQHKVCCSYAPVNYCGSLGLPCDEKVSKGNLFSHFVSKEHGLHFKSYNGKDIKISGDCFQAIEADGNGRRQRLALIETLDRIFVFKCIEDVKEEVISWNVFTISSRTNEIANEFEATIKINPIAPSEAQSPTLKWKSPISNINLNPTPVNASSVQQADLFCISYNHFPSLFFRDRNENGDSIKWEILLKIVSSVNRKGNKSAGFTTGPLVFHRGIYCRGCRDDTFLTGPRYKCIQCVNYDLCGNCIRKRVHAEHLFVTIPHPNMASQLQGVQDIR